MKTKIEVSEEFLADVHVLLHEIQDFIGMPREGMDAAETALLDQDHAEYRDRIPSDCKRLLAMLEKDWPGELPECGL